MRTALHSVDADRREELLSRLAAVPHLVAQAAEAADRVPTPVGEWSPAVVLGHLLRCEQDVWEARFRAMTAAAPDRPPHWEWWAPADIDWPAEYGDVPTSVAAVRFAAARERTVAFLRTLDETGWDRRATHTTFGALDVEGLAREVLVHDGEHVHQLTDRSRTGR